MNSTFLLSPFPLLKIIIAAGILVPKNRLAGKPITASKKIGNAVLRNRAKRRMRAAAHAVLTCLARPGWDYVLVARPAATVSRPFPDLLADLTSALTAVHRDRT